MRKSLVALVAAGLLLVSALPAAADSSRAWVSPTSVWQGGREAIGFSVQLSRAQSVTVDVDVDTAGGQVAWRQQWHGQPFWAGQTRTYSTAWSVPANQPSGGYHLVVKAFSSAGAQVYAQGSQGQFSVVPPAPVVRSPAGSATVSATRVVPGTMLDLAAGIRLAASQSVTVDEDVTNAAGQEVWNKQWPGQWLVAGQARNFYTGWPVPSTATAGNYTLTVKALNGAGQQVFAQGRLAPFTIVPAMLAPAVAPPPTVPSPTLTPVSSVSAAADPSGQALPVGNIPGWHQVFADDFTGNVPLGSFPSAVASKWSAYPDGWKDTSRNGTYMPSQVLSEHNGVLDMYIHTVNGVHLVSAPEPKIPGAAGSEGGLLYGRYAVRFRADAIPGYKTAWLLWPDSESWPSEGEIDFPEGNLSGTMCAYMHHLGASSGGDQDAYCTGTGYTGWHTAVTEWTPSSVRFFLDGRLVGTSTSRIPNSPMHWVLQTETNTSGIAPSASAAGHVLVDWVSVYTPA